ncbi:MAG TPA: hypothetical protein PKC40_09185 [Saprospiraceae bacterium]|nr:hypothetical protein [Saprospiraceae bacterium]
MELKDKAAFDLIVSERMKIRDNLIDSIKIDIEYPFPKVEIRLIDKYLNNIKNKLIITLESVNEIRFNFFANDPAYLEDFKLCFDEHKQVFYFSIDPDNSTPEPVISDCNVFIAGKIKLLLVD